MELRVDMQKADLTKAFAQYSVFSVGDQASKFVLSLAGYDPSSTAGDSMLTNDN